MTSRTGRNLPRVSASSRQAFRVFAARLLSRIKPTYAFASLNSSTESGDDLPAPLSPAGKPALVKSASAAGAGWVWRDRLLLSAFGVAALLLLFQVIISLLQPPWLDLATDWLQAVLSWPEMLPLLLASLWLTRSRRAGKVSWWMFTAAMFFYAIAQTSEAFWEQFVYGGSLPFPFWDDLASLLQYPFFFLALALLPGAKRPGQPNISRVKVVLDGLLLTAAGTALSWYFLLEPLYTHSPESGLGKLVNLAYPVGDLVLLVGLSIVMTRWRHEIAARLSMHFLVAAVILLVIADSWFAYLNLYGEYMAGKPPDVFWLASYLAFALAGLVKLRSARHTNAGENRAPRLEAPSRAHRVGGLVGSARLFSPFVAAFLASLAIVGKALMTPGDRLNLIAPFAVSVGLLILVMARQVITSFENERLVQEREIAYANDLALREGARQMDEFLGIASHELKTPLTTIMLGLQMIERRLRLLAHTVGTEGGKQGAQLESCQDILEYTFDHGRRLSRLVNDLLDTSRIRQDQLPLHQRPAELIAIVQAAVEEQRQAAPERSIVLHLPATPTMCIYADGDRIGQVVTNYVTNALKYSPPGSPVSVGIEMEPQQGRVWVSDQGPGLTPAEQKRVWERFQRIPGIEAQTDCGAGLGLGLHISKIIIEQHHGQVGVQSAPGEGSTFWFTLPLHTEGC